MASGSARPSRWKAASFSVFRLRMMLLPWMWQPAQWWWCGGAHRCVHQQQQHDDQRPEQPAQGEWRAWYALMSSELGPLCSHAAFCSASAPDAPPATSGGRRSAPFSRKGEPAAAHGAEPGHTAALPSAARRMFPSQRGGATCPALGPASARAGESALEALQKSLRICWCPSVPPPQAHSFE